MSFLSPLFFVGLGALAIPVVIHLIQRERKRVVDFPSLMFLRRIPYQSVRRRRIRHWFLLLMRAVAIALIVLAFARPFVQRGPLAVAPGGTAREVVILLDQSASMGYGDRWQRAQAAARQAVDSVGPDDRATLVLFSKNAEENLRATADRARLAAAVNAAHVGSGATRYGPALKLAQSILGASQLHRHEAVLVSDFQRTGWSGVEDIHFPEGTVLTPVSVASTETSNVSVSSVAFARATFSGQERITVTAGIVNRSRTAAKDIPVSLEIDGHQIQADHVSAAANASASFTFTAFTLAESNVRGTVHAGTDPLPQDNLFHFVLTPSRPISVLVVQHADAGRDQNDSSLYLSRALSIGNTPAYQVEVMGVARVTPAALDKRSVIVLNDTAFPSAGAGGALHRFVERGGGLLVVLGEQSSWPSSDAAMLPGKIGPPVDRISGRSGTLGFLDYSHPIFELFKAPRSGDFSGARFFRYRALDTTEAGRDVRVLARYDDGAVAAAEKRIGDGRVIAWSSTLDDSWNDLALRPVFLPLAHQMLRYLARYEEPAARDTVGQVLDASGRGATPRSAADRVALTPSGKRVSLTATESNDFLELDEQGFYEVRAASANERRPFTVAVDIDPVESDLAPLDPAELVATVTGHAGPSPGTSQSPSEVTPQDVEHRQAMWWYLMIAGVLLLAAETAVSNHLSRKERFL